MTDGLNRADWFNIYRTALVCAVTLAGIHVILYGTSLAVVLVRIDLACLRLARFSARMLCWTWMRLISCHLPLIDI